jgi:hypothetical protein
MRIPEGVQIYTTELATFWLGDDGLLYSLSKPPKRTIKNTSENFELVRKLTNGKPICHLVYICNSAKPDKATRDFVVQELPKVYKAMAMVSSSGLGKIIMNFLFALNKPAIPMKSFSNEEDAKEWLKQYR